MVKHVLILPYGGIYEYQDPTIKYLHIIYDDSFRVRSETYAWLEEFEPRFTEVKLAKTKKMHKIAHLHLC